MQKIILDNRFVKDALYPFTATRHAAAIRVGILTIKEKFEFSKKFEVFDSYEAYFEKYPGTTEYPTELQANMVLGETWLDDFMTAFKQSA